MREGRLLFSLFYADNLVLCCGSEDYLRMMKGYVAEIWKKRFLMMDKMMV